MSGLSAGIKNWHWRTKGVEGWSKEWFGRELTGVEANGVTISAVTDVEGDSEVGMRKSKLVTIYDLKITMTWTAKDSSDAVITGSLVAVEVAHDMDEDEYQFETTLASASSKEADAFRSTAKKALANKLRPIFQRYPKEMIETHGKDLLADEGEGSAPASGATTPSGASTPASVAATSAATTSKSNGPGTATKAPFNTAVVKSSGEFACTADDLFSFLTDENKIPMWSRNPAKMKPEVGAEMSLFGGNIAGKVTAVSPPTSVTTSWRAPTWPADYYGTLEMTLAQGSSSTTLNLRLSGVPVGKEDEAEHNLNIYYINGLKQIGSVFPSFPQPSSPSSKTSSSSKPKKLSKSDKVAASRWSLVLASAVPITISLSLMGALVAAFWYGPSGPGGSNG